MDLQTADADRTQHHQGGVNFIVSVSEEGDSLDAADKGDEGKWYHHLQWRTQSLLQGVWGQQWSIGDSKNNAQDATTHQAYQSVVSPF
jgi:hypothetical protein